jgi:hypothetical protein
MQGLWGVMEASTQISKDSLGGQARCGRVGILKGAPESVLCKTEAEAKDAMETPGSQQYQECRTSTEGSCKQRAESAHERGHVLQTARPRVVLPKPSELTSR